MENTPQSMREWERERECSVRWCTGCIWEVVIRYCHLEEEKTTTTAVKSILLYIMFCEIKYVNLMRNTIKVLIRSQLMGRMWGTKWQRNYWMEKKVDESREFLHVLEWAKQFSWSTIWSCVFFVLSFPTKKHATHYFDMFVIIYYELRIDYSWG